MQPYGQQQLALFRQKVRERYEVLLNKRKVLTKEQEGFQLQLITVAGGTISLYLALSGTTATPVFIKVGFALLGLSLIFGVISLFLGLESKQFEIMMDEEAGALSEGIDIDFIEKFGHQDIALDKEIISKKNELVKEYKGKFNKRQNFVNKSLKFIHLDGQRIEDGQLILFLLGIVSLVTGLFF